MEKLLKACTQQCGPEPKPALKGTTFSEGCWVLVQPFGLVCKTNFGGMPCYI